MTERTLRSIFEAAPNGTLSAAEFEQAYRAHAEAQPPRLGWANDIILAGTGRLQVWIKRGVVVADQSARPATFRLAK